jgi:hypothetical protein
MNDRATWTAFLLMCFALVGLTGLFASYATSIPLERALIRTGVLDQVLAADRAPDAAARLDALRPALGPDADAVLSGPGELWDRVAAQRRVVLDEQGREARSVTHRVRIMVGTVTLLAALVGAGIMALASRRPGHATSAAARVVNPGTPERSSAMKQPHSEESIDHTDGQQDTGNHKKPGQPDTGGADKVGGTRAGAENLEPAKDRKPSGTPA